MRRAASKSVLWLVGLLCWNLAAADARDDLLAAFEKTFADGQGLRAVQTAEGAEGKMQMTTEMLLPGRFRTRNDKGEFVIVPDGAWVKTAGSSEWQLLTLNPASMSAAYTEEGFARMRAGISSVQDHGPAQLEGRTARRFTWHSEMQYMGVRSSSENSAWVAADDGLLMRMETVTAAAEGAEKSVTQIDYTAVKDLQIEAPLTQ